MIHVLELPWALKDELKLKYGLKMMRGGLSFYTGPLLPQELRPFASEDYTLNRWIEDENNATVLPPRKGRRILFPKPHQETGAETIKDFYLRNSSGFLLADQDTTGKSLTSILALTKIAGAAGFGDKNKAKVLIVTEKSELAAWIETLHDFPIASSVMRFLVITNSQLSKLLMAPAHARIATKKSTKTKQTAKKGAPTIDWDFVIFDESHELGEYPKSRLALEAAAVAKLNTKYVKGKSPFVIFITPTPGGTPLEFGLYSKIVSPLLKPRASITPDKWIEFLINEGFSISLVKNNYQWAAFPQAGKKARSVKAHNAYEANRMRSLKQKQADITKLGQALVKRNAPLLRRKISDIPELSKRPYLTIPISLGSNQKLGFKEGWEDYRKVSYNEKEKPVQSYIARVGFARLDSIVDFISDTINKQQVYVRLATAEHCNALGERLLKRKINSSIVTARNSSNHIDEWANFIEGQTDVLIASTMPNLGKFFTPIDKLAVAVLGDPTLLSEIDDEFSLIASLGNPIHVMYAPLTVDEAILDLTLNESEYSLKSLILTDNDIEKLFKIQAAKRTLPYRLS